MKQQISSLIIRFASFHDVPCWQASASGLSVILVMLAIGTTCFGQSLGIGEGEQGAQQPISICSNSYFQKVPSTCPAPPLGPAGGIGSLGSGAGGGLGSPGNGRASFPDPYSHVASYVENMTLNYHHYVDDYIAASPTSDCGSCGGGVPSNGISPSLNLHIQRRHRYRNLVEGGSFGKGAFLKYDIRASFYSVTQFYPEVDIPYVDVFDPSENFSMRLKGHASSDSDAGVYDDVRNQRVKGGELVDANGEKVFELSSADEFRLTAHNGLQYIFEVVEMDGDYAGRIVAIRDRNGYELSFSYKFSPSSPEATVDSTVMWQLDTITDPHGRTANFSYHNQQIGGYWVIEEIQIPNGETIEYAYAGSNLAQVNLPDGTASTFSYQETANTTQITFDDSSAASTSRRKRVYFTNNANTNIVRSDVILNTASMLVRLIVNGEEEVSYLAVHTPERMRFSGTPLNDYLIYQGEGYLKRVWMSRDYQTRHLKGGWGLDLSGSRTTFTGTRENSYGRAARTRPGDARKGLFGSVSDAQGRTLSYSYDSDTFPITKTYPDYTSERFSYNEFKQVTRYEDRLGRVTLQEYDTSGNPTVKKVGLRISPPGSGPSLYQSPVEYDYDPYLADYSYYDVPEELTQSPVEGEYAEYLTTYYDGTEGPAIVSGKQSVDDRAATPQPVGLKKSFTDANGNTTHYLYDANNFLIATIDPYSSVKEYTYDVAGRLESSSDEAGRTTKFYYDTRDRVVQTLFNDGSTERVAYGNQADSTQNIVVARQDRNGNVTSYQYDNQGRVIKTIIASHKIPVAQVTNAALQNLAALLPGNEVTDATLKGVNICSYLDGTNLKKQCVQLGKQVDYEYDYRHRLVKTTRYPASGKALTTEKVFENNELFYTQDPYGRRTYYAHRSSDGLITRKVQGLHSEYTVSPYPGFIEASPSSIEFVYRTGASAANASHLITDYRRDEEGQIIEVVDPRGTRSTFEYDSRGRVKKSVEATATAVAATTERLFDANSNVIEIRHPRYFDQSDTDGVEKCNTVIQYDDRNLPLGKTYSAGAPGYQVGSATSTRVSESFTYDADRRPTQTIDERGNYWRNVWHTCCGRLQAKIENAETSPYVQVREGPGEIFNNDYYGNVTHTASVKKIFYNDDGAGIPGGGTFHDPPAADTLNEVTTRYDARNRPVARTIWLEPRGNIDPNDVPIATAGEPGLTTRMYYDDDLSDGIGLESGVSVGSLDDSGAFSLNVMPVYQKIVDQQITFGNGSAFSAIATVNPEDEISVVINDGAGRQIGSGTIEKDGTVLTFSVTVHDVVGNLDGYGDVLETKHVDGMLNAKIYRRDGAGRLLERVDALGKKYSFRYDNNGNKLSSRDPNQVGQDCVYDRRDRRIRCTDTQGDVTSVAYDKNSNIIRQTDGKGKVTAYKFDPRDRQYLKTDRIAGETNTRYDQNSNVISIVDAEGGTTTYAYNGRNLKTEIVYPDHNPGTSAGDSGYGIVKYAYDAKRRTTLITDQQGVTQTHNYDMAHRLLSRDYRLRFNSPDGTISDTTSFEYDDAGRVTKGTSGRYNNVSLRTYDGAGRLQSETLEIDTQSFPVTYDYDASNRNTKITYPNGEHAERIYTVRDQLSTVKWKGTTYNLFYYDDGGRLRSQSYQPGVATTDYGYRNDNRVAAITKKIYGYPAQNWVGDLTYDYDANKNKMQEIITGPLADYGFGGSTDVATVYDDENRLVNWQRADQGNDQSWDLSLVGDWKSFTVGESVTTKTFNDAHEIVSITDVASVTHDQKGNLLRGLGPWLYYDFDNKLRSNYYVQTYFYDAFGRRVKISSGYGPSARAQYCIYARQQVVAEYEKPNGGTLDPASPTQSYVYGSYIDEVLIKDGEEADGTRGIVHYHRNQQYSVVALTRARSTQLLERYVYDAYGQTTILAPDGVTVRNVSAYNNRYMYTGRRYDRGTGLYYFRARMYSPKIGRFTSRDPLGYVDGMSLYRGYFVPGSVDPMGLQNPVVSLPWNPVPIYVQQQQNRADNYAVTNGVSRGVGSLLTLGARNEFDLLTPPSDVLNNPSYGPTRNGFQGLTELSTGFGAGKLVTAPGRLGKAFAGFDLAQNLSLAGQGIYQESPLLFGMGAIGLSGNVAGTLGRSCPAPNSTVWNRIKATQEVWPGTQIPRSFELTTQGGRKVWVHGNATEHLAERVVNLNRRQLTPDLVRVTQQAQLNSLEAAVNAATKNGVKFDEIITVGGWELKFGRPRNPGDLPTLFHSLPLE